MKTHKHEFLAHRDIDQVHERSNLSFHNNYSFLKKVDMLPTGPGWKCEILRAEGDLLGDDGQPLIEELELWWREPVECVKELVGNPAFKKFMSFVPEQVFSDKDGKERVLDEMWTADWWWNIQVRSSSEISHILMIDRKKRMNYLKVQQ